jgi:hypothetical protein
VGFGNSCTPSPSLDPVRNAAFRQTEINSQSTGTSPVPGGAGNATTNKRAASSHFTRFSIFPSLAVGDIGIDPYSSWCNASTYETVWLIYGKDELHNQRGVHGVDLGVAFVGLPPDDERRIRAAIEILSRHKLLPTPWRSCAVTSADLVIVAPNNPASQPLLASAIQRTGPVTAVLVAATEPIPPGCERLLWPVRPKDLRSLLLEIEQRVVRQKAGANTGAGASSVKGRTIRPPRPPVSLLELAHTLRAANEPDSHDSAWIVRGIGPRPLYVVPGTSSFLFEGSLSTLRNLPLGRSLTITRIPEQDLPCGAVGKPLIMLQWLVGMLLGQKTLLPWVDPAAAYSLRHWPDFALLRHRLDHQRIAALLRNRAAAIPDIVHLAQVDEYAVNEFLNAASLTGRLVAANAPQIAASRRLPDVGGALLQRLRKVLGIGADR